MSNVYNILMFLRLFQTNLVDHLVTAEIHVEVVCVAPLQVGEHRHLRNSFKRIFFPEKKNVYRLEKYIKMARQELLICVFNLTNNVLADAIKERYDSGVDVRIITDDECMTNKGNDC